MAKDKLTLRLTVEVTYDLNGTDPEELEHMLGHIPTHYAGHGAFTEDTPATVDTWCSSLVEVLDEVECDTCLRRAKDKAEGDPCEHCSGQMVELTEESVPQLVTPVVGPDAGEVLVVGDECPNCQCGTLEASDGEVRCAGECGCVRHNRWNVVVFKDKNDEEYMASAHVNPLRDAQIIGLQAFTSLQTPLVSLTDNSDEEFVGEAYNMQMWEDVIQKARVKVNKDRPGLNGAECDDNACPGWGVFYRDGEGTYDVERCDVCQRFDSDDEALAHVYKLESADIAQHLFHHGEPFFEWLKNEVQMPRLLAELYALMELSEDTETMQEPGYLSVKIVDLCESMDLSWARIQEIFQRADDLWEEDKRKTLEKPHVRNED